MKKLVLILMVTVFVTINAQQFSVEKISGDVYVLRGTSEQWIPVKTGDKLSGKDVIQTSENATIRLQSGNSSFVLQRNAAVSLGFVKSITLNDLLLALAMEDIRNVPKNQNKGNTKNTAVYGEDKSSSAPTSVSNTNELGIKRLNGAKQLAQAGYKESGVLAAKETYRMYPSTKSLVNERMFFVDLLIDMKLYSEALEELQSIKTYSSGKDLQLVQTKTDLVKNLLATHK